jgi:malonyl-CoA decarboxylase
MSKSFLNRTLSALQRTAVSNVLKAWGDITGTARAISGNGDPDLSNPAAQKKLHKQYGECLFHKGGEVSARRKTIELGQHYLGLSDKGKERFLKILASDFAVDNDLVAKAILSYQQDADSEALREALEAPRSKILRQFSSLPQGIKFLVDMRADLLRLKRNDKDLYELERDLRRLLAAWFDVGLLDMQEITWYSPAALLEKLIAYEAVHAIASWSDLKNRLDSDRRCFAFFHHKMPNEPLIFVEVALTDGIADNIHMLLDEHSPVLSQDSVNTAVFYSISNAQAGLNGISFGNFLIKRVVDKLSNDISGLKHFVTLSPMPGFRVWLEELLHSGESDILLSAERKQLCKYSGLSSEHDIQAIMLYFLDRDWWQEEQWVDALKAPIMRLGARYILNEKKKGKALDPVSHFHLSNGAQAERLNWLADKTKKGMKQSLGLMINYYYDLNKIEENHEVYTSGKAIPSSHGLRQLLKR